MGSPSGFQYKENKSRPLAASARPITSGMMAGQMGTTLLPQTFDSNSAVAELLAINPEPTKGAVTEAIQSKSLSSSSHSSSAGKGNNKLAAMPRILSETYEPNTLSDAELIQEIVAIVLWLESNRSSSTERVRVETMLSAITTQMLKRGLAKEFRSNPLLSAIMHTMVSGFGITSLPGLMVEGGLLGAGMELGFLEGASLYAADHSEKVPVLERLKAQNDSPANRIMFAAGNMIGVYWGAITDFLQNVVGLGELAMLLVRYGTPIGQAYGDIKKGIEFIQDPSGYKNKQQEEARAKREIIEGVYEFMMTIQKDPTLMMEIGEQLGIVAGAETAQWFDEDFVDKQTPFEKGMTVGKFEGTILMEVLLLFIGPEELLAKGGSAAGSLAMKFKGVEKLVLRIGEVLEKVPVLKRLMDIRKLSKAGKLEEIGHAVVEGEKAGELSKTVKAGGEAINNFDKTSSLPKDANWLPPDTEATKYSPKWKEAPPMMSPIIGNPRKANPWKLPKEPKVIIGEGVPPGIPEAYVIKESEKLKKPPPRPEMRLEIPKQEGLVPPSRSVSPYTPPEIKIQVARKSKVPRRSSGGSAESIQKFLEQEGLTPTEIIGFGGEDAQYLDPESAARVERLREHFTPEDLKNLGNYLFDSEIILDDATVDKLIISVRKGKMGEYVRDARIAESLGELTQGPGWLGERELLAETTTEQAGKIPLNQFKETPGSKILGAEMIANGRKQTAVGYHAHHIIPENQFGEGMNWARERLEDAGSGVNKAQNGAWLAGSKSTANPELTILHNSYIHAGKQVEYAYTLTKRLSDKTGKAFLLELEKIGREMENGLFKTEEIPIGWKTKWKPGMNVATEGGPNPGLILD